MNMYGKLPQERAMQKLVHDHNSQLSQLRQIKTGLNDWIEKNAEALKNANIKTDDIRLATIQIDSRDRGLRKVIDEYYKKFNDDFPDLTKVSA